MASEMQRIEVEITEVKRKMLSFAGKVIFDAPVLLSNFFAMQGFMFHLALLFFILSCSFFFYVGQLFPIIACIIHLYADPNF